MADRPILFSAPMVRALLDGRKTQTRRALKEDAVRCLVLLGRDVLMASTNRKLLPCAPGDRLWVREAFNAFQFSQDGDDAWPVKIPTLEECKEADELAYRYGAPQIVYRESDRAREWFANQKWRPSTHMPRWASRLTLTVTDVRVERLQDISEADATAEGATSRPACSGFASRDDGWPMDWARVGTLSRWAMVPPGSPMLNPLKERDISLCDPQMAFANYWGSIHGPGAWDANPWVAAISFDVRRGNIDEAPR